MLLSEPFIVTLIIDDYVVETHFGYKSLAACLRKGRLMLTNIPQAELCIRRKGSLLAWLHTNHRGELNEAEIHVERCRQIKVTALNPDGPIFETVFVPQEYRG